MPYNSAMTREQSKKFIGKTAIFNGRKGKIVSVVFAPKAGAAFKIEFSSKSDYEMVHSENSTLIIENN